jgi:hypothetical protein
MYLSIVALISPKPATSTGIATERRIRGALLENAKRLLPLRRVPLDLKIVDAIVSIVRSQREPSLGTVLDALSVSRRTGVPFGGFSARM